MHVQKTYDPEQELALLIMKSVKDQSLWEPALDLFSETFGVSGVSLMTLRQFDVQARKFFVSEVGRTGPLASLRAIIDNQSDEDGRQAYEDLIRLPERKVILETDAYQSDSVDDLPPSTFRSALIDKGYYQRGVSLLNGEGPWIDGLFYQFQSVEEVDKIRGREQLPWVFDMIAAAAENSRVGDTIFQKIMPFTQMLDRLQIGAYIVDGMSRVMYQNNQSKLFQESGGSVMVTRSGKLAARDPQAHERLQNIISLSCDIRNRDKALLTSSVRISLQNDLNDLPDVASFCPLFFGADNHGIDSTGCLVLIAGKGCTVSDSSLNLGLVAGLTRAEMAVLNLLLDSKTAGEIASERDVSAGTVKSQIKSIYSKLRCNSQPEVLRLASLFALPVK